MSAKATRMPHSGNRPALAPRVGQGRPGLPRIHGACNTFTISPTRSARWVQPSPEPAARRSAFLPSGVRGKAHDTGEDLRGTGTHPVRDTDHLGRCLGDLPVAGGYGQVHLHLVVGVAEVRQDAVLVPLPSHGEEPIPGEQVRLAVMELELVPHDIGSAFGMGAEMARPVHKRRDQVLGVLLHGTVPATGARPG